LAIIIQYTPKRILRLFYIYFIFYIFCSKSIKQRYTIVVWCSKSEPEPGWVDNMNGVSSIITPLIVGVLRTIQLSTDKVADIVPVDYTANALISVMWDTVNRYVYCLLHVTYLNAAYLINNYYDVQYSIC